MAYELIHITWRRCISVEMPLFMCTLPHVLYPKLVYYSTISACCESRLSASSNLLWLLVVRSEIELRGSERSSVSGSLHRLRPSLARRIAVVAAPRLPQFGELWPNRVIVTSRRTLLQVATCVSICFNGIFFYAQIELFGWCGYLGTDSCKFKMNMFEKWSRDENRHNMWTGRSLGRGQGHYLPQEAGVTLYIPSLLWYERYEHKMKWTLAVTHWRPCMCWGGFRGLVQAKRSRKLRLFSILNFLASYNQSTVGVGELDSDGRSILDQQ